MRRHKETDTAGMVVTSDGVGRLWSRGRRLKVAVCAIVVLLLLAVVGSLLYVAVSRHNAALKQRSTTSTHGSSFTPTARLNSANTALANASSTQDKVYAYLSLGGAYMDNHQYSEAIAAYQQAENLSGGKDITAYIQLSNLYNMTHQRTQLIATLQQIVTLMQHLDPNDPVSYRLAEQLPWYQDALKRVQAGGNL